MQEVRCTRLFFSSSPFVLSKGQFLSHQSIPCLPKMNEKNLPLITEDNFDFIICLVVISYIDSP
jgi:hypothetical protein